MIFLIIQQILISLAIIVLVHYLIKIIQNKFTTPKVIDLVENTDKEYNKICKIINLADNENITLANNLCNNNTNTSTEIQNKNNCVGDVSVPTSSSEPNVHENLNNDTTSLSGLDEKNKLYTKMNGELQSYFDNM